MRKIFKNVIVAYVIVSTFGIKTNYFGYKSYFVANAEEKQSTDKDISDNQKLPTPPARSEETKTVSQLKSTPSTASQEASFASSSTQTPKTFAAPLSSENVDMGGNSSPASAGAPKAFASSFAVFTPSDPLDYLKHQQIALYTDNIVSTLNTLAMMKNGSNGVGNYGMSFINKFDFNNKMYKKQYAGSLLKNFEIDDSTNIAVLGGINLKTIKVGNIDVNSTGGTVAILASNSNEIVDANLILSYSFGKNDDSMLKAKTSSINVGYGVSKSLLNDTISFGADVLYNLFMAKDFQMTSAKIENYKLSNILVIPNVSIKLADLYKSNLLSINIKAGVQYVYALKKNNANINVIDTTLGSSTLVNLNNFNGSMLKSGISLGFDILETIDLVFSFENNSNKFVNFNSIAAGLNIKF